MISYCRKCLRLFPPEVAGADGSCPHDGGALVGDVLLGGMVGDYKITGLIGEGGMGVVFAAEHVGLHRRAAIKVLRGELVSDKQEAARFAAEARIVSRIGHPNIIDIFDIGEVPDGRLYYVMELLTGRSLAQVMREGRLPFSAFLPIIRQTCEGLEAAHAVNIVHRDLKPDNLFLVEQPGEAPMVKVLDFGVAKVLGGESAEAKLTRTGNIVGTPQYMSPEQIDGGSAVDRRTDIYALGVILYELATGALPFKAETIGQMLKAHLMEDVPAFNQSSLAPGVPPELEPVIFKALAKQAPDRYPGAKALAEDLDRVAAGVTTEAASWWTGEANRRETLLRSHGGTTAMAMLNAGIGPSQPGVTQVSTLAGTLLLGPQARRWQALALGIGAAIVLLLCGGGALLWKRSAELKRAEQRLLTEKRRIAQRDREAREAEERRKKKVDLMDLRSRALAVLQEGLRDGDPALRGRALAALGQSRDTRHRTLIEPLLKDPDTAVQAQAAAALGQLGARSAVPALLAMVGDKADLKGLPDLGLAMQVAEALDRLGDPTGQALMRKGLKVKDDAIVLRAALLLSERGDKAARKLVQKRLKKRGAPEAEVVMILGRLARAGDAEAQRDLGARLPGPEAGPPGEAQLAIASTLARAGDERARALIVGAARQPGQRQLLAARLMAALDDPAGYDLFRQVFADAARPLQERALAAEGLGACGEKAGAQLLATALPAGAGDSLLRQVAAASILQIAGGDPALLAQQSLSWAQSALGDESWSVRESAVAMLGDADPGLAVPLLGKAIKDAQPEVRQSAAHALGRTRVRAAVAVLGDALDDNVGGVRVSALRSIGQVGTHLRQRGEKAIDDALADKLKTALLSRADKGDAGEQVVAAATLLRLGDSSRKDKLKGGLSSDDPEVRKLAVEESAADPETAKVTLASVLKDPSFPVRFRAARELADQGSREGVPVLKEGLGRSGPDGLVAYGALKKLGEATSPPGGLGELLSSGTVADRVSVIEAVAQMPVGEALPLLRKGARDGAAAVRRKVVEVAGDLPAPAGGPAPGLPVLRMLLGDQDVAVRSRAGALVARLSPREPEAAPEPKATREPARAAAAAPDMSVSPALLATAPPDLASPVAAATPDLAAAAPAPAEASKVDQPAAAKEEGAIKEASKTKEGGGPAAAQPEPKASKSANAREEAQLKLAAAELYQQSGKYDRAAREMEAARKLDPKLPLYFSLGEAYRHWADGEHDLTKQKKLVQKAIDAYKKAKDPKAQAYIEELKERLQ